ncbi:MAG: hypothetical protein L0G99_08090 [Propionibacteriales bacterium]|nr:hypothetical protein [Propionibacteriales bacterium]
MGQLIDSGYGYDFLPGVAQYSGAVVARDGYSVSRVRLTQLVAHDVAFELIGHHLAALELPSTALCAVELRCPEPFSEEGFADYNERYRSSLTHLGVDLTGPQDAPAGSPLARSMLCPVVDPPSDVSLHAFSYVSPTREIGPGGLVPLDRTFVVSGSAEVPEGRSTYRGHIVARGDISQTGLRRKTSWVLGELTRRLGAIGADWPAVTAVQAYTGRDMGALIQVSVQPMVGGAVDWHACLPPIADLEFEMDCRRVGLELSLAPTVS